MDDRALAIAICKRLCRAAANGNPCSHCVQGVCSKDMWETFAGEAVAVIEYLKEQKLLKRWR